MSAHDTTLPRREQPAVLPVEWALRVLSSPDLQERGQLRRLPTGGLLIGRGDDSNARHWRLADPRMSREHAEVRWDEARQAFVLVDRKSRNGTRLNGREVDRETLGAGDVVRLGDTLLQLGALDAALDPHWVAPDGSLLLGASTAMQRLHGELAQLASAQLSVLIEGETGSGKDVVARELHRLSGRAGRYVAINCAALVESLAESELFGHRRGAFSGAHHDRDGVFVQAHGGTLLLDEVGELPAATQAKLLRVLEDKQVRPVGAQHPRQVDVRVLSATNRTLAEEVAAGRFRADLYARIHQWSLTLAPLRERLADVLPIFEHALSGHGHYQLDADAHEAMLLHRWPYNVRELVTLARKVAVRLPAGGTIELHHVIDDLDISADAVATATSDDETVPLQLAGQVPTRNELDQLLRHFKGSVSPMARHLGRGRTQVYRWLSKYDLDPKAYR